MPDDENTIDVSVRLPESYVERLMDHHPVATRPQDAIRTALHNDMDRRTAAINSTIQESAVERLERSGGGTIENIQRIRVGPDGQLEREGSEATDATDTAESED